LMATPGPENYKELLLFLATAGVIVPLFGRLKLSPVFGFLAAGIVLGPFGLGALAKDVSWLSAVSITDVGQIAPIAEFGVAFLLFMIALELSWNRLIGMRRLVFGLGALQVVVSAAALAIIASWLGQSPASAAVIGSALAMSSTAIILPSLAERKRLNTTAGRASFAVLLFQDLSVAPLLFMVAMLGTREGTGLGTGLLYALTPAVVALVGLAGLGRLVLRPLFQMVAATRSNELFVAACLLVVIGAGLITALSGQSMALGAFIAGLLLAETEYRRQIEVAIQPFQGLLLGLFFVSVGARLDLSQIIADPAPTIGVAAGFAAVKAITLFPIALLMGLPKRAAGEVAIVLGPGSEFALILIGAAVATNIVSGTAGATTTVAATLTMVTIPLLIRVLGAGRALRPSRRSSIPRIDAAARRRLGARDHCRLRARGTIGCRHACASQIGVPCNRCRPCIGGKRTLPREDDLLRRCDSDRPAPALRNPARSCAGRHLGQRRGGRVRRPRRAIRAPRPHHRCARAGRCARQQALRPESHGCGAGNHRGQPAAFRGSAHRYWDTDGAGHRFDSRKTR